MPDLTIHDMPEAEVDALLARAERHGRSLEQEARHVLHEAAAEQMLVMELERATRAVDAKLAGPDTKPRRPASGPRRRVKYEPTPRRG